MDARGAVSKRTRRTESALGR